MSTPINLPVLFGGVVGGGVAAVYGVRIIKEEWGSGSSGTAQAASPAPAAAGSWLGDIEQAAQKYGVPVQILTGVMGMETSFGQNISTSSGGAVGGFQFIPSTAASYGYPLTNTPDATQQAQQADSAAHYLSDLFRQTGDWNRALEGYSGGGYGLAQVQAKAAQAPSSF